ncbi:hypothetical protein B0H16DRAFT_1343555 [Mycena metata]|uniref:Reverse transcriptase zinc-binding domain-containing protein n=1 Tax=Mycena metata TaxID=1033252 RepID=A0AAD7H3U5_9AGAR|nr:hypothetical protein B0H16DRAFT_1343555 [Mycena metata]
MEGFDGARALAEYGSQKEHPDNIISSVTPEFELRGAKLSSLTQAIAYAEIKKVKGPPARKATDNMIKQVQASIKQNFNRIPLPADIWKSVRHKDFTRQVRNFLWKSLQNAHRIGNFWTHIPECEDRAICQFCGVTEDLEHILLKCERPGQHQIWNLAKELWLKKHDRWPDLSLGAILGCGLASISNERGKKLPGASRLFRIILSKSLFTIWKIRNDCVIGNSGTPPSLKMIHNKWLFTMNRCLELDRTMASRQRQGTLAYIKPLLVLQTWVSTLKDEDKLPDNWLRVPRVLVGVEPHQPSATPPRRRGRNR